MPAAKQPRDTWAAARTALAVKRAADAAARRAAEAEADYAQAVAEYGDPRPRTRGDCASGPRPCPWVSCRHHLALDLDGRGQVRLRIDPDEWTDKTPTCALDVAEGRHPELATGGDDAPTLTALGALIGLTREAMRQLEAEGIGRAAARAPHLRDLLDRAVSRPQRPERIGDYLPASGAGMVAITRKMERAQSAARANIAARVRTLTAEEVTRALIDLARSPKAPSAIVAKTPPKIASNGPTHAAP